MPRCQSDSGKEVAPAARRRRLAPDKSASGHQARLEGLLDLLVLSQQAALPERGLENIVQRSFYPLIWNVALADQAEDGRIERCYVPLPIGKGAGAIVDLLIRDLRKCPGRSVVDDIIDELIEVAADTCVHALQKRPNQKRQATFHVSRAEIVDERFPVASLLRDIVEHREEHNAFNIDIGAPRAADNILELGDFDPFAMAVERVHDNGRGRKVEALRQGGRRDCHLEHIVAQ